MKIEETKQAIISLLEQVQLSQSYIDLVGAENAKTDRLIEFLCTSDYFEAPASTRYHLACRGGLAFHSMNVMQNLWNYHYQGFFDAHRCEIILAALLHDLCKVNMYNKIFRWRKNADNDWETYEGYEIKEDFVYGHGEKSVYIAHKYVYLTDDTALAIRAHMGFSDATFKGGDRVIPNIFTNCPLALYLSFADQHATFITEKGL